MKKGMNRKRLFSIVAVILLSAVVAGCGGSKAVAEIPDPLYYFDMDAEVEELSKDEKMITFYSDEHLWSETAGYINMMKSDAYPFQTHNETWEPGIYNWYFEYTGSGEIKDREVTQIEVNYYAKDERIDRPTTIRFKLSNLDSFELTQNVQYEAEGEVGLPPFIVSFNESIAAEKAAANAPTVSSQNNSSSESSSSSVPSVNNDLYDARVKCGLCDNGDCKTCGGDGYLWSSASDKEDRNCYKCNWGNCRNCGGDGWLD